MKTIVGYLIGALVLGGIGALCLNASRLARALADTERDLVVLDYSTADATFEQAERYYGYASLLPWVGNGPVNDVRARWAAVKYWQGRYDEIVPDETEPVAAIAVDNVKLQEVVANAVHRTGQKDWADEDAMLEALNRSINAYLTVLRNAPDDEEAAFNYEYLIRLRGQVEAGKAEVGVPEGEEDGPLGQEGGPSPEQGNVDEFKIYIPLESEELEEGGGAAGKAAPLERKG